MLVSSYYKQQNNPMLPKFTKQTFKPSLIEILRATDRNDEKNRTIMNAFGKSLSWLEQKYDKQSIRDAASRIRIKGKHDEEKYGWIFVIQGCLWLEQIAYLPNEFINHQINQKANITFQQNSTYAILTFIDLEMIKDSYSQRSNKKIIKFLRKNIFYSHYLQEQHLEQFTKMMIIHDMPYKAYLNWNHIKQSNQMAIIYKGALSIQYKHKRNFKIAEITKGMMVMNIHHSQQQELMMLKLGKYNLKYASKFKYISISDETRLFIFSLNIFLQSPFKEYSLLINKIKPQYENYCQILKKYILFDEENRLYRRKQSIKKYLKQQKYIKEKVIYDISYRISTNLSPDNPKIYSSMSMRVSSTDLNHLSQSIVSLQSSNKAQTSRLQILTPPLSKKMHVHNAWIESINKKKPNNTKSFSLLHNNKLYHSQRQKRNRSLQKESQKKHETNFFIPEQFIKKSLKMKFQGIIPKIKHMNISLNHQHQNNVSQRLKRLQSEIQQRRIVKLDKLKRKNQFLRDKFLH